MAERPQATECYEELVAKTATSAEIRVFSHSKESGDNTGTVVIVEKGRGT